jgi:hypothetical protein
MSKLSSEKRKKLPDSAFAEKGRKYPINDRAHAANAKARASQQVKKGNLSREEEREIDAKANRKLYGSSKGGKSQMRSTTKNGKY